MANILWRNQTPAARTPAARAPSGGPAAAPPLPGNRPVLSTQEFQEIRKFIYAQAGIDLHTGKEDLVSARLGKILAARGVSSYQEYLRQVRADTSGAMLAAMIDALTTNYTGFLREPVHFEFLRRTVLPAVERRPRIDIWSAACSTGEEPYSIACVTLEALGAKAGSQVRILASDISTRALGFAREALYPAERTGGVPPDWQRKYLARDGEGREAGWRIRPEVRRMVEFQRLNLMEPLAAGRRCPVIFLRNVMIYFDRATQEALVKRLMEQLEPGGYLLIGHSESLTGMNLGLEYVAPATYKKPGMLA